MSVLATSYGCGPWIPRVLMPLPAGWSRRKRGVACSRFSPAGESAPSRSPMPRHASPAPVSRRAPRARPARRESARRRTAANAARRARVSRPGTERPALPEADSVRTRCASVPAVRRSVTTPVSTPPSMRATAAAAGPAASSMPFAPPEFAAAPLAPVPLPVPHAAQRVPFSRVCATTRARLPIPQPAAACRPAHRVRPHA